MLCGSGAVTLRAKRRRGAAAAVTFPTEPGSGRRRARGLRSARLRARAPGASQISEGSADRWLKGGNRQGLEVVRHHPLSSLSAKMALPVLAPLPAASPGAPCQAVNRGKRYSFCFSCRSASSSATASKSFGLPAARFTRISASSPRHRQLTPNRSSVSESAQEIVVATAARDLSQEIELAKVGGEREVQTGLRGWRRPIGTAIREARRADTAARARASSRAARGWPATVHTRHRRRGSFESPRGRWRRVRR